jgi:hypothetical protein
LYLNVLRTLSRVRAVIRIFRVTPQHSPLVSVGITNRGHTPNSYWLRKKDLVPGGVPTREQSRTKYPHPPSLPYIFLLSSTMSHSYVSSSIFFTLSSPLLLAGVDRVVAGGSGRGRLAQGRREQAAAQSPAAYSDQRRARRPPAPGGAIRVGAHGALRVESCRLLSCKI